MDGQKAKSVSIVTDKDEKGEEKTSEVSNTFADYKDVNGIKFPYKTNMMMGEMGMNGEVKEIIVNGKIDAKVFKK
jgi:5S rRNA maturation endonuclease (ribonuclease M5)